MQDSSTTFSPDKLNFNEKLGGQSFFANGEKRIQEADNNVNKAVHEFVNGLGYGLTDELLKNFDDYRKNPDYSGLTDSDTWLKSIEEVYHNNPNKMPGELEKYLLNMLDCLIKYKAARGTLANLSTIMRSEISIKNLSETTSGLSWDKLPPFKSKIRPMYGYDGTFSA